MKLPLAVGLLSLLPVSAWSVPVTSSIGGGEAHIAAQAGAQRSLAGMVFGGFFTLYSFAPVSPLLPAAAALQIAAVVPAGEPPEGSPYAQPLVDEPAVVRVPDDAPAILLARPAVPILPAVPIEDAEPAWVSTLPPLLVSDPMRPGVSPVLPTVTDLPEPSTLGLAALAVLALVAGRGNFRQPQPRSSRRRILPTGLFGRSSRNSTIFGRL